MHKADLVGVAGQNNVAAHLSLQHLRHTSEGILCHGAESCLTEGFKNSDNLCAAALKVEQPTGFQRHMTLADHLSARFCKGLDMSGCVHRHPVAFQQHQCLVIIGIPAREGVVVDVVEPIAGLVDAVHKCRGQALLQLHGHMDVRQGVFGPDIRLGQIDCNLGFCSAAPHEVADAVKIGSQVLVERPPSVLVVQLRGCVEGPADGPGVLRAVRIAVVHNLIHTVEEHAVGRCLQDFRRDGETRESEPCEALVGDNRLVIQMARR